MAKTGIYLINLKEHLEQLEKLKKAAVGQAAREAVEAGMRVIEGWAVANIEKTFSGKQSGTMASNHTVEVMDDKGAAVAVLTFHSNHARVQELGGTIRPVNGQFLAIPLTDIARKTESPRNYPDALHFVGSPAGGVLMNDKGEVIYALKTSVTMPPRAYLRPAMDEHHAEINQAVAAAIEMNIQRELAK